MLRSIPAKQLLQWEMYAEIEPFDETREDLRTALICSVLANIHRDPKRRSKPYTTEDFMLKFGLEEARTSKQTMQQQQAIARLWVTAFQKPTKKR